MGKWPAIGGPEGPQRIGSETRCVIKSGRRRSLAFVITEPGLSLSAMHSNCAKRGAGFWPGGAPGDGEGEATLYRVEVGALREGEAKLVPEGSANGGVEYGP